MAAQAKVTTQDESLIPLSKLLKASADPLRLQVLQVLRRNSYGVLELTDMLETTQSGMSHHLKVLASTGMLETHKQGNAVFYRRPNYDKHSAQYQLIEMIDSQPLSERLVQATRKTQAQRSKLSQQFFERHALDLQEQQELICDYEHYASLSFESLTHGRQTANHSVLEIGPGAGLFLKNLSQAFQEVDAVDNSSNLLEEASRFCDSENLSNVKLILGEATQLVEEKKQYDAIVMNMVLHHVASPAELISECGALLGDKAILTICDLCSHDQSWAHESCGDLWLGFDHEQLNAWAKDADLNEVDSQFIGLRNGFQIQICTFKKQQKLLSTH